eukprot:4637524-Amphidinium_carterae.1
MTSQAHQVSLVCPLHGSCCSQDLTSGHTVDRGEPSEQTFEPSILLSSGFRMEQCKNTEKTVMFQKHTAPA